MNKHWLFSYSPIQQRLLRVSLTGNQVSVENELIYYGIVNLLILKLAQKGEGLVSILLLAAKHPICFDSIHEALLNAVFLFVTELSESLLFNLY